MLAEQYSCTMHNSEQHVYSKGACSCRLATVLGIMLVMFWNMLSHRYSSHTEVFLTAEMFLFCAGSQEDFGQCACQLPDALC